jgi:GH25 family lysozyme M1 (1,4-beta-N-acetylmuramidase)
MQTRNSGNAQGIDVSRWQGPINWQAVKHAGIQFVMMKATEGTHRVDPNLHQNYRGAKDAGIPLGFYHFAHVSNDPVKEAEHYLLTVSGLEAELWHVLDMEHGSLDGSPYTKSQVSEWSRLWLNKVQECTGKMPMIYTGASFAGTYFEADLCTYPLWVAHYGTNTPMSNPVWDRWTVFQYSETGRVDGISGHVDLNELDGNLDQHLYRTKGEDRRVKFTDEWQWGGLTSALHGLYEKSVSGELEHPLVTDYKWAAQAYNREMKLDDLAWLAVVLLAKDKGVDLRQEQDGPM